MKLPGRRKQDDTLRTSPGQRARAPQRREDQAYGQNRTFSYHAARSQTDFNTGREAPQEKPPLRRLPTRLQRLRKHTPWLAGGTLALALVIYQLQLSTTPRIVSLATPTDAQFLQASEVYQRAAQGMFNEAATNRNKLTVDADRIAARLEKQFPELQQVSVSMPLIGATPNVYVKPAQPAMVLASSTGAYIVDQDGRALAEVNAGTNLENLKVPSVTDQSGLGVKVGQQVLPRSAAAFISTVGEQLTSHGVTIQSMTLPAAAGELDVYVSGKPYFVKFNLEQGSEDTAMVQVGTFLATLKKLQGGKQPGAYVDVRLEGRAYYK